MRISDEYLDSLITEDLPYLDLTTHVLGIGDEQGRISYYTRDEAVLCGTEEAARIIERLGATVLEYRSSGSKVSAGETFLVAEGPASALHSAWKCCLNIFEYYSALATKARRVVESVHAVNPACEVLTTRKMMPGTKPLDTKAILVGGAFPHRLGLSETVLVFDHHLTFYGGKEAFVRDLPEIRRKVIEKKLFIETSADDAETYARAGVDGLQFDKIPPAVLAPLVKRLRAIDSHLTLIAAGGVNEGNAAEYAATGVDGLATTCLHFAKPLDMSVSMERL